MIIIIYAGVSGIFCLFHGYKAPPENDISDSLFPEVPAFSVIMKAPRRLLSVSVESQMSLV